MALSKEQQEILRRRGEDRKFGPRSGVDIDKVPAVTDVKDETSLFEFRQKIAEAVKGLPKGQRAAITRLMGNVNGYLGYEKATVGDLSELSDDQIMGLGEGTHFDPAVGVKGLAIIRKLLG